MNDLVAEYFPPEKSMEADEQIESILNARLGGDGRANDDARPVMTATRTLGGELETNVNKLRAGESYRVYNAQDVFGRLPDRYAIVLSRAACWAGVSEDELSEVIERFERRLVRRWKGTRGRSKVENESDEGSTSS